MSKNVLHIYFNIFSLNKIFISLLSLSCDACYKEFETSFRVFYEFLKFENICTRKLNFKIALII